MWNVQSNYDGDGAVSISNNKVIMMMIIINDDVDDDQPDDDLSALGHEEASVPT